MPDLTDAHRAAARRCVTLAGMPPPADEAARARRSELIDALAAAIADAEVRGPAGGRTDPTDAEETAYRHGLEAGFAAVVAAFGGFDPPGLTTPSGAVTARVRAIAVAHGVEVTSPTAPPTDAGDSHDAVAEALTGQRPDPAAAAHAAAADRLSWSGSEGLIITPPPAQDVCNAYYGVGDGTAAHCIRPTGHPPVSEDGIGHADAARLQSL